MKKKIKVNEKAAKIRMIFQLVTVFLFAGFSVIMGILFLILPKKEYSEVEKRKLMEFPKFNMTELSKGYFTDNLTKYVSDNFTFRDGFVDLGFKLEDKRGVRVGGVKIYSSELDEMGNTQEEKPAVPSVDTPLIEMKPIKAHKESAKPGETLPMHLTVDSIVENADLYKNLDAEDIMGEQRGALFMVKNTALEIFYGNSDVAADYCNVLNTYNEAVGDDVTVYNLIIPTHFEFGLPNKYKDEVGRGQKQFIDQIAEGVDSSVVSVDAYSNLKKHYEKGEYLYFNSDHHWTALGAYRAYTQFAKAAGFKATALKNFEKRSIDEFLGTFYTSTYDKNLKSNPDRVDYYVPQGEFDVTNYYANGVDTYKGSMLNENVSGISSGYLVFMGGDIPLSAIKTNNNTGRKILVFKESYGNPFIPFIATNYDELYVADIRTFPFNAIDFVKENDIGEVLFINNTMTSCTPARIQNYINLMQK